MSRFRSSLTVFAAALYVLLGISASWHAPHFMRGEAAIGVDAHNGAHETGHGDTACALCSGKMSDARASAAPVSLPRVLVLGPAASYVSPGVVSDALTAARARAPPAHS